MTPKVTAAMEEIGRVRPDVAERVRIHVSLTAAATTPAERWSQMADAQEGLSNQCGPNSPPQWRDLLIFRKAVDCYMEAVA